MSKLVVRAFSLSADGYGAGPEQSLEHPLGLGGKAVHGWMFPTRTFRQMIGAEGGSEGADDGFARASFDRVGAWIMGRNMFGPVRGPWPDRGQPHHDWKGWWGEEPPYHVPVFVLTHHPRPSLPMRGGTTFHFVTGGLHEALERARAAAGGADVRIGGGVQTVRGYLREGLVDEMHLVISPVLLGRGESLLQGIDLAAAGLQCHAHTTTPDAMHLQLRRG